MMIHNFTFHDSLHQKYSYSEAMSIHNYGSTISELYELHVPYMLMYESNLMKGPFCTFISISPIDCNRTVLSPELSQLLDNRVLHQHDFFELMFVLSGTVRQRIEDQVFQYTAGQACLLNRNIRHYECFTSDFEAVFLMLSNETVTYLLNHDIQYSADGSINSYFGSIYQLFKQNQQTKYYTSKDYIDFIPIVSATQDSKLMLQIYKLVNQMIEENTYQHPGYIFFMEGLFSRFFSILENPTLYQKTQYSLTGSTEEILLSKIGHLLEERNGRISRKELESIINYNSDYMNRVIKKYTGMTLTEYGLTFSLRAAQKLLMDSDKSITEIISELGFTNRSYFYRIFRQKYGMTPAEYRQSRL